MAKTAIMVLDRFAFLDSTRADFYKELSKTVNQLLLINFHSFDGSESAQLLIIEKFLSQHQTYFCLSINAVGIQTPLHELLKAKSIPFSVWYWDSPSGQPTGNNHWNGVSEIFYACDEFNKHPGFENRGEFLPFSGARPIRRKSNPEQGICFLGSCWHIVRVMQKVALGLTSFSNGKFYDFENIYDLIVSGQLTSHKWKTINNEALSEWDILNAFSSIKRCQQLTHVIDLDLKIFGGFDWLINCAPVAPQLSKVFNLKLIKNHREMSQLMSKFKVSLNIFHWQNRNGGPNFRIFDSIVHGVPILSDYNERCASIFPHQEAAIYYKNPSEMRESAKELLSNETLCNKLVQNSREIMLSGHLHKHRIKRLYSKIETPKFSVNTKIVFINERLELTEYETASNKIWCSDNYGQTGRLHDSEIYKIEKYWVERDAFQQWEIKAREMKIAEMETQQKQISALRGVISAKGKDKIRRLSKQYSAIALCYKVYRGTERYINKRINLMSNLVSQNQNKHS